MPGSALRAGAASPAPATPAPSAASTLPVLWSLNGLRAAGALLVMLYHVNSWNLQVVRGSSAFYTGVGLFFVLSGFVLTWTARPGTTVGAFHVRRLARIVPNHLVAYGLGLVVTVLVVGTQVDLGTALAGVFLVQSWSPDSDVVFAVNGVTWSLSCEIAFYAVFPFLLWGLRRLRARTRVLVVGTALAVPPVIGLVWPTLIPLLFHLPVSRLPEFALGMVTALAVQEGWHPRLPAPVLLAVLAAGILGAAAVDVYPTALTAALAAIFAPLAARCAWGDIDGRNAWARHPVVMLGGALSFSFYLLHELVIRALLVTPLRGPVATLVVLVVSTALAFGLWRGVELPARAAVLAAAGQPAPRLGAVQHTASRRPRHSRPRSVAWSFPVPPVGVPARAAAPATTPAPAPAAAPAPVPSLVQAAAVAQAVAVTQAVAVAAGAPAHAPGPGASWAPPQPPPEAGPGGDDRPRSWAPPAPPASRATILAALRR